MGKAGRTHYYEAYEQHSEVLRAAIQKQVDNALGAVMDSEVYSDGGAND